MKKFYKKILLIFIISFGFLFLTAGDVFSINYISTNISVICEKNGTAHINEIWEVDADSGTEMFLGKENLDRQVVSNLKVSSDGKEYKNIGVWNTSANLKDKSYKCGIIKKETGCEICWGLSSYGKHVFNVSYDMSNLVKECVDGSFINQIFINKLPSNLSSAKVTIEQKGNKFTNENTKIWAGGGAIGENIGEIFVKDGKIEASTTYFMSPETNFGILAQFNKGMFSPEITTQTTFKELKEKSLEGTEYQTDYNENKNNSSFFGNLFSTLPYVLIPATIYIFSKLLFKKKRKSRKNNNSYENDNNNIKIFNDKFRKEYKSPDYSRKIPFENSLSATYTRLKNLNQLESEYSIIGVYLLKWISSHQIELVKVENKKMFRTYSEDAIKIKTLNDDAPLIEKELFEMLMQASEEQILQKKNFERWCRSNFISLSLWLTKYNQNGFRELKRMGVITEEQKKFLGLLKYIRNELSDSGIKYTSEMFGFKKYLEDFTIINEREAKEVELWKEYLIYAQIFGIAEKVSKQFQNLYPRYFDEKFDFGYNTDNFMIYMLVNNLTKNYVNSAQSVHLKMNKAASAGLGGSFKGGGFKDSSGDGSSGIR